MTGAETVLLADGTRWPLWEAQCCCSWPVLGLTPLGHCGYCNEVPAVVGPWKAAE